MIRLGERIFRVEIVLYELRRVARGHIPSLIWIIKPHRLVVSHITVRLTLESFSQSVLIVTVIVRVLSLRHLLEVPLLGLNIAATIEIIVPDGLCLIRDFTRIWA